MSKSESSQESTAVDLCRNAEGFTLLEALMAIAIFSIGILAVAGLQTRSVNVSTESMRHIESDAQITDMVERLKSRPWVENDGDVFNDDPLLEDLNGDGAPGLANTDAAADYTFLLNEYTIFYNVANNINQNFYQNKEKALCLSKVYYINNLIVGCLRC